MAGPRQPARVSARYTIALLRGAARAGLDRQSLLRDAGVDDALLAGGHGYLPVARHRALWRAAVAAAGEPDLGLRLGAALELADLGPVAELVRASPTCGQALGALVRYLRVVQADVAITVARRGDAAVVELASTRGQPGDVRFEQDYWLAGTLALVRDVTGQPAAPRRVELPYPRPPTFVTHARVFGCELVFGAPRAAMQLATTWLDRGRRAAPPAWFDLLADPGGSRSPELLSRLRAELLRLLPRGVPDVAAAAAGLGRSPSTLQRQLRRLGTTFHEQCEQTRHELAAGGLAARELTTAEVAVLAGFGDAEAFTRAFARWTGEAPDEYRAARPGTSPDLQGRP